jgi:DnaK suppressor protein
MAKSPEEQRHTDRVRAGRGTGKLDRDAARDRDVASRDADKPATQPSMEELRARLLQSREGVREQLRRLGLSPERDDGAPRAGTDTVLDEGDEAQASERQDLAYATRQRLVERVNRLTAALDRVQAGTYGRCAVCGEPIEPGRLAALPEAETCLRCQAQREQAQPDRAA